MRNGGKQMRPKGKVKALGDALASRGFDTSSITDGRCWLKTLVDDCGDPIRPDCVPHSYPRRQIAFQRISMSKLYRSNGVIERPFRINSSLAVSEDGTSILWLG